MYLTRRAAQAAIQQREADGDILDISLVRVTEAPSLRRDPSDDELAKAREALGDKALEGARVVPFVISTEKRASDGHTIAAEGWDLEQYRKNPVVLWGHETWAPRIGDSAVWVDTGDPGKRVLRAAAVFFPREVSELSHTLGEISALRGHAASVGFRILAANPAEEAVRDKLPWALDIVSARLLEWSLVNVPADPDAIAEARERGIDTQPLARALDRLCDLLSAQDRPPDLEAARAAAAPQQGTTFDLGAFRAGLSAQLGEVAQKLTGR